MSVKFNKEKPRAEYKGADRYTTRQFLNRQPRKAGTAMADVLLTTAAGQQVVAEAKAAQARIAEAQARAWQEYCASVQALQETVAGIFGLDAAHPGLLGRWDIYQQAARRGSFHNLHADAGLMADLRYATVDPDVYRRVVSKLCGSAMGFVPESVASAYRQAMYVPAVIGTRVEIIDKLSDKDPADLTNEEICSLSFARR